MKGVYLSITGLSLVNLPQFVVELGLLSDGNWLLYIKGLGFILLIWGAILSYRQNLPKEILISKDDYDSQKRGYFIPYEKFCKDRPLVRYLREVNGKYEEPLVAIQYIGKDILIECLTPSKGKIIIK